MINIAERPQEADDRAVPGHWEGDLMIGKANKTAIGTLVERATGYALLVHLPDGYKPEQVAPALAAKIQTLPDTYAQGQPHGRQFLVESRPRCEHVYASAVGDVVAGRPAFAVAPLALGRRWPRSAWGGA